VGEFEGVTMPWFWQAVLLMMFVVPFIFLFGYAAWDVFRRHDTSVGHKLLWLVLLWVLPILGPLLYIAIRPPGTTESQAKRASNEKSATQQLLELAALHDSGKLTDQEYQTAKAQHIGVVRDVGPSSVGEQRPRMLT
jgi:Phospholipase_D-nuclease N-terminal